MTELAALIFDRNLIKILEYVLGNYIVYLIGLLSRYAILFLFLITLRFRKYYVLSLVFKCIESLVIFGLFSDIKVQCLFTGSSRKRPKFCSIFRKNPLNIVKLYGENIVGVLKNMSLFESHYIFCEWFIYAKD